MVTVPTLLIVAMVKLIVPVVALLLIVKLLVPVTPPLKVVDIAVPVLPTVNVPTVAFVAKLIALATVKPVVPTNNDAALLPVVSPKVTVFVPKALADVVTLTVPALMVVPPV